MHIHTTLILASNSPRRRELLRQAGYRFVVKPPSIEDRAAAGAMSPAARVESLAYMKAMAAVEAHGLTDGLVLAADTAVELAGRLIGKPADHDDARRILAELSGSTHRVITGMALVDLAADSPMLKRLGERRLLAHDVTEVRMRRMTPPEIDAYVASGEATGKAGAYALQETGDRYVERLDGSASNVVGLPIELLERMIEASGYNTNDFR